MTSTAGETKGNLASTLTLGKSPRGKRRRDSHAASPMSAVKPWYHDSSVPCVHQNKPDSTQQAAENTRGVRQSLGTAHCSTLEAASNQRNWRDKSRVRRCSFSPLSESETQELQTVLLQKWSSNSKCEKAGQNVSRPGNAPHARSHPGLSRTFFLQIFSECGLLASRTFGFVSVDTIISLGCVLCLCSLVHQAIIDYTLVHLYYTLSSTIVWSPPSREGASHARGEFTE